MSVAQFNERFREEHRQLRDMLLGLIDAFQSADPERVREGVEEMAAHAAPHFHYEQEFLYPALADLHGDDYVEKLVQEHARTLEAAARLAELADQEEIDEEAAEYGLGLIRELLPHVTDRDGLAVMIEVLEPKLVGKLHTAQKASRKSGVSLATLTAGAKKRARVGKKATTSAKAARARTGARMAPKKRTRSSAKAAKRQK